MKRPVHISKALQPVIESLRPAEREHRDDESGALAQPAKRRRPQDDNISGCCGAPLLTEAAGPSSTRYRCSQCRRVERIG